MPRMAGQTATLPPVSSLLRAKPASMPRNNSLSRGSSSPPCSPRTPATELEASSADAARASGSTSPAFAAMSLDAKRRPPPLTLVSLRPSPPSDRTSPGDERRSISSLLNGIRAADPDAPPLPSEPNSSRERSRNGRHHVTGPPPLPSPGMGKNAPPSPDRFASAPPHTAPMRSSLDAAAPVTPHYRPTAGPPPPASEYHWATPPGALTRRHSYHPAEYYPPPHHPAYYPGYHESVYVAGPPGMGPYDPLGGFGAIGARAPISRTTKACDSCRARKVRCDAGGGLPGRPHPCSRCRESARPCHYSATQKKRGPCPGRPASRRVSSAGLGGERPVTGHDAPRGDPRDWDHGPGTAPGSAHGRPPRSAPARPADPWPWSNAAAAPPPPHDDRYHPYARPPTAPHPHSSPRDRHAVTGWESHGYGHGPHGPPPPPPGYPPNAAPRHAPSPPMFDAHYSMHPHPGSPWPPHHAQPPSHAPPHGHGPPPPPHLAPPPQPHGRRHDYPRRSVSPPLRQ